MKLETIMIHSAFFFCRPYGTFFFYGLADPGLTSGANYFAAPRLAWGGFGQLND